MEYDREFLRRFTVGLFVLALFLVVAYVARAFTSVLVFAVFLYYAVRPVHRTLSRFGLPRRVRAVLALVLFGVPFLVLFGYTVAIVVLESQEFVAAYGLEAQLFEQVLAELDVAIPDREAIGDLLAAWSTQASVAPVLAGAIGTLTLVGSTAVQALVTIVLTYYMLVDGPRFTGWLLETFDETGVLERYTVAVDAELSLTLFGNIVNVFVTAIVGVVTFYAYNAIAPATVQVPFPALVGALSGIGSLIPVVGIKLVYVPITIGLAGVAVLSGELHLLVYVGILVAVSAVVVDFIPDFFIRAMVSGDQTHTGLLIVAYIVGPIVFGAYGLFLAPILLVLTINATYVLLPYVLSGEPVQTTQTRLDRYGSNAIDRDGSQAIDESTPVDRGRSVDEDSSVDRGESTDRDSTT
ncbi:MAG: AI-2E family transporter [Halobacteriota archaeon]